MQAVEVHDVPHRVCLCAADVNHSTKPLVDMQGLSTDIFVTTDKEKARLWRARYM
jgi:hypothetical protein